MKCSKCGKRFNSLPAMAKHYRKKHPAAMKRKTRLGTVPHSKKDQRLMGEMLADPHAFVKRFCPHCGGFLG